MKCLEGAVVQVDSPEVQRVKTLIRYCEAKSAGRMCGANTDNLHFLDMPFYETGAPPIRKFPFYSVTILISRRSRSRHITALTKLLLWMSQQSAAPPSTANGPNCNRKFFI